MCSYILTNKLERKFIITLQYFYLTKFTVLTNKLERNFLLLYFY